MAVCWASRQEGPDAGPGVHALKHHTMGLDKHRHRDPTPEKPFQALPLLLSLGKLL